MATVSTQMQSESSERFRFGILAFAAAVLIVGSQLLELSGPQAPNQVSELTVSLILAHERETQNIIGAVLDALGLFCVAGVLYWVHRAAKSRAPQLQQIVRYISVVGPILAGVMAILYIIVVTSKANTFVSSGTQGYMEAKNLTTGSTFLLLPLVQMLGQLMLTIGCIWTSLSAMRVGLFPKIVGYAGVVAGALFLFGSSVGALSLVIQGFFLAAVAVVLVGRWPQGDPPAWEAGVAVPWPTSARQQAAQQAQADRRAQRAQRGKRGKVSDSDVLAAVNEPGTPQESQQAAPEPDATSTPSPSASSAKRKRKRRN
jgi:hypothetical protein